jgi:hypothetical protein
MLIAAAAVSGCGTSATATQTGLRLQREDLIATARALEKTAPEAAREAVASKAAWPLVAHGLPPASLAAAQEAKIADADAAARALRLPALFGELRAAELTGPGASIAGVLRSFVGLSTRGWQMLAYALRAERRGGTAARFARANAGLYIEAVYDGHFALAQVGKKLLAGWEKLGGEGAFGSSLTHVEVQRLAGAYSERNYRLHPHDTVKLGS